MFSGQDSGFRIQLCVLMLFAVILYYPALTTDYAYSDDYRHVYRAITQDAHFPTNIAVQGRPVYALLLDAVFSAAGSVEHLRYVRAVSLLGVMLFSASIFISLLRMRYGRMLAWAVAALAIATPSTAIIVGWASTFQVPYAALLAWWAAVILSNAKDLRFFTSFRMTSVVLLITASCMLYQPAAFFFVLYYYALWLRRQDALLQYRVPAAVFAAGVLLFYVLHHTVVAYYTAQDPFYLNAASRGALTHAPLHNILWFFQQVLPLALWPTELHISVPYALIPLFIFGAALALRAVQHQHVIAFVCLPLVAMVCYAPSLAVVEPSAPFRTLWVVYMAVGLAWFAALQVFGVRAHLVALAVTLVIAGHTAQYLRYNFIQPYADEYQLMKNTLAQQPAGSVITPKQLPALSPFEGGVHEFGAQYSIEQPWVREGMVHLLSDGKVKYRE